MANRWRNSGWLYFSDGDCSHEIKRLLLLGRKVMTNLDSILKSKEITLPAKVSLVKAMVFQVVIWMWEWNYKETWVQNWCFWTVVLKKTLQSPLDCKEIQPVHSKGHYSGCSLEGVMLKLKLQHFGHLMQRADSFEKTPMLGKIEGRRRRGQQRMRWLDGIINSTWVWVDSRSWWWTGRPGVLRFMGSQRVRHNWALNWTGNLSALCYYIKFLRHCIFDHKSLGIVSPPFSRTPKAWHVCTLLRRHSANNSCSGSQWN